VCFSVFFFPLVFFHCFGVIFFITPVPRKILYEEFGNQKQSYRPDYYYAILTAANRNGIPFMPWEFLIPPSTGDQGGLEFDTHQASYPVLVFGVLVANRTAATHRWSNLELCGVHA
jgi:hypothetical protein